MAGPVPNSDLFEYDRWLGDSAAGGGVDHIVTAFPFAGEISGFTSRYSPEGRNYYAFNNSSGNIGQQPGIPLVQLRRYYADFNANGNYLNDHRTTNGSVGPAYDQVEAGQGWVYQSTPGSTYAIALYEHVFQATNSSKDHLLSTSSSVGGYTFTGRVWYYPRLIGGCTDPTALNYSSFATQDNGTCQYGSLPSINSFSFSPNIVCPGNNSTLSWDVDYDPNASGANNVKGPDNVTYSQVNGGSSWVSSVSTNLIGQWTLTTNNAVGTSTSTATLSNYDTTDVNFTSGNQTIIFPDTTTLTWSSTGQSNVTTINQGIGSVNNSGSTTVSPTETTTYTITSVGLCNSDTDSVTITVYYQPEANIDIFSPQNYGAEIDIDYNYEFSDVSAEITAQYVYKDSSITTNTITLPPSSVYGSESGTVTDIVPYNDIGPFSIIYTISVVGSGGSTSEQETVIINIDQSPDILNIPDTDNKLKDESPVFAPDNIVTSPPYEINDIDIPVEITANQPIKISFDGGVTFTDIKETP